MQTPRMRVLPGVLPALVLSILPLACGGGSKDATSDGKAEAPAADGKTPDVKAAGDGAAAGDAAAGDAAAGDGAAAGAEAGGAAAEAGGPGTAGDGAGGTGGAEAGTAAAGSDGAGADETAGAGETGAAEETGGSTGGGVDVQALLKEIKSKRTKDDRVEAAVAEAEAAGVETLELAKALTKRGEALFAAPDRAKAVFELALEKDATYPNPAFNLAKQAAMLGELDEAKKWLTMVKERKGKKLLKQIDFDPMWEILKDDPDVRALLR